MLLIPPGRVSQAAVANLDGTRATMVRVPFRCSVE